MKDLTKRQGQVLAFITEAIAGNGIPPSVREIANYFSISPKGAHDHIIALEKKKYIIRSKKGHSRSIIVVDNDLLSSIKSEEAEVEAKHRKQQIQAYKIMNTVDPPFINKCVICGTTKNICRHHEDYKNPTFIIILCPSCHRKWHSIKKRFKKAGLIITVTKSQ